jgi:hypothetical protein
VNGQHVPVFVSSTFTDLQAHRVEVERVLVGLEQIVKGMEYFGSSPDTPLDVCMKQISECQLFILIVGLSYGSIDSETGKSYTELEYDYVVDNGIKVLAYLADKKSTTLGIAAENYDRENADALEAFRKKVAKNHTVTFFKSIDDLGKCIGRDFPRALAALKIEKQGNGLNVDTITEKNLRESANKFQLFWLRPIKHVGEVVPLRAHSNRLALNRHMDCHGA